MYRKKLVVTGILTIAAIAARGENLKPIQDQDGVYFPGHGVIPAKLTHAVPAVAIQDSRLEGLKHICAVNVVIGADGVPASMEIVNKITPPFDEAAKAAIRQSQFEPGRVSGKPVPVRLMVWVPFFGKDHSALPVAGTPGEVKELQAPKLANHVESQFSEEARQHHQPGRVVLRILVTEEGLPARAQILIHAPYGLDEQALATVAQYRFRPALLEGVPVPMPIIVEVNFQFSPS